MKARQKFSADYTREPVVMTESPRVTVNQIACRSWHRGEYPETIAMRGAPGSHAGLRGKQAVSGQSGEAAPSGVGPCEEGRRVFARSGSIPHKSGS